MTSYESAHWTDFALGQLGASAALCGLVFVGLSINLRNVVQSNELVNRAAEAVLLLSTVLVTSTAVLIPGQDRRALGVEMILVGGGMLAAVVTLERHVAQSGLALMIRRVSGLGAVTLVVATGVSLAAGSGGGLYLWPGAIVLAYLGALGGAWVLLVEILR